MDYKVYDCRVLCFFVFHYERIFGNGSMERSSSVKEFYLKRAIHIVSVYWITLLMIYFFDVIKYFPQMESRFSYFKESMV